MCRTITRHWLPATKSAPLRSCSLLAGDLYITKTERNRPFTTVYRCEVVGADTVTLTKECGTVYRVTERSCSCPSRVPCVHIAAVKMLAEKGELFATPPEVECDPAELFAEMDAYFAAAELAEAFPFC